MVLRWVIAVARDVADLFLTGILWKICLDVIPHMCCDINMRPAVVSVGCGINPGLGQGFEESSVSAVI